ncbi:hypothetical protein [Variovorax sp. tm]|uniref:hypothetical protein n=1 Tax=Variovorax atrisoli TaxID=3394203 RepID=UPI003A7FAC78
MKALAVFITLCGVAEEALARGNSANYSRAGALFGLIVLVGLAAYVWWIVRSGNPKRRRR